MLNHIDAFDCWQCGVDANAIDRVLLRSSKPALHANFDCNALAGAVVSRQISVVRLLLQVSILEINHHYWSLTFVAECI